MKPTSAPIKSLHHGVAFNAGYRESWRSYLNAHSHDAIEAMFVTLTQGMDPLSVETCRYQLDLMPYFFPHPILNEMMYLEGMERRLLSVEMAASLKGFGFFKNEAALIGKMQAELGLPEPPLPEFLTDSGLGYIREAARKFIARRVVVDAGAYIGDSARLFQKRYRAGKVLALEPDPVNFSRMSQLVSDWKAGDCIVPVLAATGREAGELKIWGSGVGVSSIMKSGQEEKDAARVPMMAIDDLVAWHRARNVAMIKLDVEGAEYDTILGAERTIREQRPLLLISLYHTARDFFEIKPLLESWDLGYSFMVRKLTPDFIKEFVLIAMPEEMVGPDA